MRKLNRETGPETPEAGRAHPDIFWRAEKSVSQTSILQQSDGSQPLSVLIPSISTPFIPAADRERSDLAGRCQTHLVSCWEAESGEMQQTKCKEQDHHCMTRHVVKQTET